MPNDQIRGLKIVQNMMKYAELEAKREAFLDALFAIEIIEKDIDNLIETEGHLPEIRQIQNLSLDLKKKII